MPSPHCKPQGNERARAGACDHLSAIYIIVLCKMNLALKKSRLTTGWWGACDLLPKKWLRRDGALLLWGKNE